MQPMVSASEAARQLGVSEQRVRQLIASGELVAQRVGRAWLVKPSSLRARQRRAPVAGQPLSASNAWALLLMADGERVPWITPNGRWRIGQHLERHDLAAFAPRLRGRAERVDLEAHEGELSYLRDEPGLMLSGLSAAGSLGLGLQGGPPTLDAYVPASRVADLRREHGLLDADATDEANVALRAVDDDLWSRIGRDVAPLSVVLIDLLESDDPRARAVAVERLRARVRP